MVIIGKVTLTYVHKLSHKCESIPTVSIKWHKILKFVFCLKNNTDI